MSSGNYLYTINACTPSVAVTAISILENNQIVVAHSSFLVNVHTSLSVKLFRHQVIHILCSSKTHGLLCCGGRSIGLVNGAEMVVMEPESRLSNWIVCAEWFDEDNIAVLFAHNNVSLISKKRFDTLISVQCDSCCIVYGGSLVVEGGELVCCSGTVFNKPLLWKPLSASKGSIIAEYSGHTGVIFDVKLTNDKLFTVSDDRSLIIWERKSGNILRRLYGHTSRVLKLCLADDMKGIVTVGEDNQCVLWSEETGKQLKAFTPHTGNGIRSVAYKEGVLVTGGWDSSVVELHLSHSFEDQSAYIISSHQSDPPKWVSWINVTELLVQFTSGALHVYDTHTGSFDVLIAATQSEFKGYSKFCKVDDITIIGGIRGSLCVFEHSSRTLKYSSSHKESKIFSLTAVSTSEGQHNQFLCCHDAGDVTLFTINKESLQIVVSASMVLPKSRNRWITAALSFEEHLIVGDRRGGIHLYNLSTESELPISTIVGLHGENGISQLARHGDILFKSVGRDGNMRYFKVVDKSLIIVRKDKVLQNVCWIERIISQPNGTAIYYFHAQCFKGTILETGESFLTIKCGGGHRSWDMFENNGVINFAYISSANIHIVQNPDSCSKHKKHRSVSHGSEIHSAIYIGDTFMTAGEDCNLILHSRGHSQKVSSHISSVRSLCGNSVLFSGGGRGSLKAWNKPIGQLDLELLCDYSIVSNTHITVGYNSSYKFDKKNPDNDIRIITLDSIEITSPLYSNFVYCGLSDGHVNLLGYTHQQKFTKILSDYQTNCITKLRILPDPNVNSHLLVSTTTFGMVHLLQESDGKICNSWNKRMHTSGINGLDVRTHGPSSLDILTIGDDGDVIRSCFADGEFETSARRTVHFSAGIAVRFLNSSTIVSVGSDQRLMILNSSLDPLHCFYTDVADPHDLVLTSDSEKRRMLICGKGYQEFLVSELLSGLAIS